MEILEGWNLVDVLGVPRDNFRPAVAVSSLPAVEATGGFGFT